MGTSIHIYSDLDEYLKRNKDLVDEKREVNPSSLKCLDMIVRPDDKIMVVLDCEKFFDRPDILSTFSIALLGAVVNHFGS